MRKNKILSEAQKRRVVKNLLREEILMFETYNRACDLIIREERRMIREGYSRQQINEDLGSLLKTLGGSVISYFKQYFVESLLAKVGFDPKSFFGSIVVNCIEEFEFTDFAQYFGGDSDGESCRNWVELLIRCALEGLGEQGIDKLSIAIFGERFQGIVSGSTREALGEALKTITESLRETIATEVCKIDFTELATGLKGVFSNLLPGS